LFIEWLTAGSYRSRRRSTGSALLALSVCLALLTSCSVLPQEEEPEALPEIRTPKISQKPEYPVKKGTLVASVTGTGKLMSAQEDNLMFEEDNRRVTDVFVKAGDRVKKGQVLARLETGDTESQIARKEIEIEKTELDLKGAMRDDSEQNEIALRKAQLDYKLLKRELEELREKLANATLVAPYDGTIVSFTAEKGDLTRAYEKVGRIADTDDLVVAVKFDSSDLSSLAPGMETTVSLNANGELAGKVGRMPVDTGSSDSDSLDGYALIEVAQLPEAAQFGTPLSASVVVERREDALYIPVAALRSQNDRNYVLVANADGTKGELDVEVGLQTVTDVQIISGLAEGQKVVGK